MVKIGVVLGTGFSGDLGTERIIETGYGNVRIFEFEFGGKKVCGVKRHEELEVPDIMPEKAYMLAFKWLGVDIVYATSATGRLTENVVPGNLLIPHDVIRHGIDERRDTYTQKGLLMHGAPSTIFHDDARANLIAGMHASEDYVKNLYKSSETLESGFFYEGIAHVVSGPTFRTPAEEQDIRGRILVSYNLPDESYTEDHDHLIGMTAREAFAALEMGIPYALVLNCTDHSSYPNHPSVTHPQVLEALNVSGEAGFKVLEEAVRITPEDYINPLSIPIASELDFNYKTVSEKYPKLADIIQKELDSREN